MGSQAQYWSTTPATNSSTDPDITSSNTQSPDTLDDNIRSIMAAVAKLAKDTGGKPARELGSRAKHAAKAAGMAGEEIDRRGDQAVPVEEQARRKRRLIKGPSEFREMRERPKAKR